MDKYLKKYNMLINITIGLLAIPILFYIFIGFKSWMNADSSFLVDYSLEVLHFNCLLPSTWINSNDFWVYSLVPLISIFLKIGFSYYSSRQLSVFFQSILLFWVLYDLFKNCYKDKEGLKIVLLLLLSGVSGQFLFEVFGDGSYGTIILYMLISVSLFTKYQMTFKKKYAILFGILLLLITSCSLRFPIYIGAPIICCLLFLTYHKGIKKENIFFFGILISSIVLGFIGNLLLRHFLVFVTNYNTSAMVTSHVSLQESFFRFAYNYFFVCGAAGQNIISLVYTLENTFIKNSSSPFIIFSFIKMVFAFITIVIPILLFKKINKMSEVEQILLIFSISFCIILSFFMIFCYMIWFRYLVVMLFFLLLLYPLFYKYYMKKKMNNRVVFHIMMILFIGSSFVFSTFSYFSFKSLSLRENPYQGISDFLISKGFSFGYVGHGNEANVYNTLTNGKLQVLSLYENGKAPQNWLTSTRYREEDYYQGKVFFMRTNYQKEIDLEKYAIDQYEYGDFIIFVFDSNHNFIEYMKEDTYEEE